MSLVHIGGGGGSQVFQQQQKKIFSQKKFLHLVMNSYIMCGKNKKDGSSNNKRGVCVS